MFLKSSHTPRCVVILLNIMKKKRILIIGAGPGGLTGAMLLASKGYDVTVYEKNHMWEEETLCSKLEILNLS